LTDIIQTLDQTMADLVSFLWAPPIVVLLLGGP